MTSTGPATYLCLRGGTSPPGQSGVDDPPVQRRPQGRPSSTKWAELKPVIYRLYMTEDKTLREVTETLRTKHDFAPTERSVKRWLAAWGWRKNIQAGQIEEDDRAVHAALQAHHHHHHHHLHAAAAAASHESGVQKGYVRLANGHFVDVDRLADYMRRKRARRFVGGGAAADQNVHRSEEKEEEEEGVKCIAAVKVPWRIDVPDDLRVCEVVFVHTRDYTDGQFHNGATTIRAGAELLIKHRACAVRWLEFVGGIKDALKQGRNDMLALRMRSAPQELASMIRLQPYSILCSLYMFVLQTSAHMCTRLLGDGMAQLQAVVKALMRYGATIAQSMGLPDGHPLPQLLRNLAMVPDNDLGELVFRVWGVTWQWWGTVSLEGILDSQIAVKCAQNFYNLGENGDMMTYTFDVLNECRKKCETQYGPNDERTIRMLLAKAELDSVNVTEKGLNCYEDPGVVGLYLRILQRAKGNEPATALATRFFRERSEAAREDWARDVPVLKEASISAVPSSTAHLYMELLAGAGGMLLKT